jgi:hypothetical protein
VATQILAENANRANALIQNLGGAPVYVATDNLVTTSNGIQIPIGGSKTITHSLAVWVVSGSASQDLRFEEESL